MAKQPVPKTMIQAVRQFADPQVAHDFFVGIRWPNGVACPRACGSINVTYLPKYRRWYCNDCKGQFTAKVGTIFEDSPIGFDKWLPAIWLIASNRNGISSCELARALNVTQKTAWFMLHRIREAFAQESFDGPLPGPVEVDETYVGGVKKNMHESKRKLLPGSGSVHKTPVLGLVQRGGKVRAFVVPSAQGATLKPLVRKHVKRDAFLYTDAHGGYYGLGREYLHYVIDHVHEYVRGHVHTNNIEAFWSVLKRTLKGTYIAPRPQHLQRYVEEQVYRFNLREEKDGPRFAEACAQTEGKRLTYKRLTAKGE